VVKPKRYVVHIWELDEAEAVELGPLLRRKKPRDEVVMARRSRAGLRRV